LETGETFVNWKIQRTDRHAFSLVELLVVVAIMAIVLSIIGLSIYGMRTTNVQNAAIQVSNGLSLARQLAIANNSPAAFILWTNAPSSATNLPPEPYKYWAVVYSTNNKTTGNRAWLLYKDWERLPEGVVFYDLRGGTTTTTYRTINDNPISDPTNTPFKPTRYFTNKTYTLSGNMTSVLTNMPALEFQSDGAGSGGIGASGIRLIDGVVDTDGNLILRNTNRYMFVETDNLAGRIRVRPESSYRR
jgi:prepilin-type N-terminal cleavage/methylation domain-containing protein